MGEGAADTIGEPLADDAEANVVAGEPKIRLGHRRSGSGEGARKAKLERGKAAGFVDIGRGQPRRDANERLRATSHRPDSAWRRDR